MKDVNKIILIGRLGADPIQRSTKNGVSVIHFPMATTRRLKVVEGGATQEEEGHREETQWHQVVVWGRQGEICAQYLKKGQLVYVEGMVRSHTYLSKNGGTRISFEIHADDVNFLGSFGGRVGRDVQVTPEGATSSSESAVGTA